MSDVILQWHKSTPFFAPVVSGEVSNMYILFTKIETSLLIMPGFRYCCKVHWYCVVFLRVGSFIWKGKYNIKPYFFLLSFLEMVGTFKLNLFLFFLPLPKWIYVSRPPWYFRPKNYSLLQLRELWLIRIALCGKHRSALGCGTSRLL